MKRLLAALVVAVLLPACTITSTPAWVRQLEACQEITDETLRVECITAVDTEETR